MSHYNHNNRYIQPNNRNYNNNISTIHITNINCSSKHYQCIQGIATTHKIVNKPTRNKHPLFKITNDALADLPTPSTIRGWWNFGSLLGICLVAQIVTGLFLAIHYCPNIDTAFNSTFGKLELNKRLCSKLRQGIRRRLVAKAGHTS